MSIKNKILIVDDEQTDIHALVEILSLEYAVFIARDGPEAIKQAKKLQPDMILLDLIMPDMDGYDVINILKSTEDIKNTPVIFITGIDEDYAEEKALKLGAADFITKPFNPEIVKLRVKNQIKTLKK